MVWFRLVWFFMLQLVRVVLVSIHTKFELSMCIVCPTSEINMPSAYLKNGLVARSVTNIVTSRQALLVSSACEKMLTKVVKEYALIQEMSWRPLNVELFGDKMFIKSQLYWYL